MTLLIHNFTPFFGFCTFGQEIRRMRIAWGYLTYGRQSLEISRWVIQCAYGSMYAFRKSRYHNCSHSFCATTISPLRLYFSLLGTRNYWNDAFTASRCTLRGFSYLTQHLMQWLKEAYATVITEHTGVPKSEGYSCGHEEVFCACCLAC